MLRSKSSNCSKSKESTLKNYNCKDMLCYTELKAAEKMQ